MTVTSTGRVPIGVAVPRREDAHLLTGATRWTANLTPRDALHAAFVRSPLGHARLVRVDVGAAAAAPGVVAVLTAADLPAGQDTEPSLYPSRPSPPRPLLARDVVRFAGEPVAVVLASSQAEAVDAAELVDVDYDPLPALLDAATAAAEGALPLHEGLDSNVVDAFTRSCGRDVDTALAEAERDGLLVRRRFTMPRVFPAAMEPRAVLAAPDRQRPGGFVVHTSTQSPHLVRHLLAVGSDLPVELLRVVAPDVGGGFGGKLGAYAEDHLCLLLARRMQRPVAWVATRSEDVASTTHGRVLVQDLTLAATRDGVITALDVRLLADVGAYVSAIGAGSSLGGWQMYPGVYRVPAYRFAHRGVLTNATPVGAYRGAGRPEATYAIERVIDELAGLAGLDPVEVRRRNWVTEFPHRSITGLTYDVGDYAAATDRALELAGYDELRAEQARRRAAADPVALGVGLATYVEVCGGGIKPSREAVETATVRLTPDGRAEAVVGTSPYGTGHETSWAQIVSDVLGVPFQRVQVVHGDTGTAPDGFDSYGSRSLIVGGTALHAAAIEVREAARGLAAQLLECDPVDLELRADPARFEVRGTTVSVALAEVAAASYHGAEHRSAAGEAGDVAGAGPLPADLEPGLACVRRTELGTETYPHGTHVAVVEVDTATGQVRLRDFVAVDDVGTVVNPLIVEGQQHGGIAQGIAQALYEEAGYDELGNLLSVGLGDYGLPAAVDLPALRAERTVTASTTNSLGAKGVGETGAIGAPPAVLNAVLDALRPHGVGELQMPCTPERVWRALRAVSR